MSAPADIDDAIAEYAASTPKQKRAKKARKTPARTRGAKGKFNGVRHDPAPRALNQLGQGPRMVNKDPDRHYVFANPSDAVSGYEAYMARGYEPEIYIKDGPRCVNGEVPEEGQPIRWRSHVCMSLGREEYEFQRRHGDGNGGMGLDRVRAMRAQLSGNDVDEDTARSLFNGVGRGNGNMFSIERKAVQIEAR